MATIDVDEQIKMLIKLQELDKEIFDKKRILDSIPERIKALDDVIEKKSANLKSLEDEHKKLHAKRKEKEMDLETKEQTIRKYQAQLFQVKTNKEYASLEKEIATLKADSSVLEEEIIGLLDEADEFRKDVAREKESLEGEKRKVEQEKTKLDEEKRTNETAFKDLKNRRREFVNDIDKNILSKYERILHNKNGLAMVPVISDSCGGCNMNLPPQVINETKLKRELIFCGNCARILYAEE